MSYLHLEATASALLDLGVSQVWSRIALLPEAFDFFPLINRVHELEKDRLYRLELGPFGYKSFSANVECEVTAVLQPEDEIVFESVPDSGNADVRATLQLEGGGDCCSLDVRLEVTPRIPIPRLIPVSLLKGAANATLAAGLQHGIQTVKREIEAASPGSLNTSPARS
jgi:hypothetical protein